MVVKEIAEMALFESELANAGDKLVVVDFYANWCGPCKMISPKLLEMSNQYTNVIFLKVDVDENTEAAEKYAITALPTFVFIKNKEKVDSFMGANVEKLKDLLEKNQ